MPIVVKKHIPSGTIILQRPERRNALDRTALTDLRQAFSDLHQEKQVRAVILTGAGEAFCSGIDLREMNDSRAEGEALQTWYEDAVLYSDLLETMLRFPKPIIAAVSGAALGAGAGLVLASDVVIAATDAQFGLPEPRRGLVAGMTAPLLAFRIGAGWAANLLLTAATLDASQAAQRGLFHEVVPAAQVWARAHQVAEEISRSAPESIQLTRRLLYETLGEHLLTQIAAGAAATATARTTEAAAEGLAAFVEKRPPKWL
ncbi:MAG: enoyl-CoA hydratase/isomerase family protein [Pirellulales bacterium]